MSSAAEPRPEAVEQMLVGAVEYCDLPELGIRRMQIRVDTGAATSSLHVDNVEEYREQGKRWVSFDIHPRVHRVNKVVRAKARVVSKRKVKSSTADTQRRIVISTSLRMGGQVWPIQLTLTDRSAMTYPMLLGRQAMAGRILVDPGREFVLGRR